MVFPAQIAFLLAIAAVLVHLFLPPRMKDPYADQPDTFRVWQAEPQRDYGCSGCFLVLTFLITSFGFVIQNQLFASGAAAVSLLCLASVLVLAGKQWRQRNIEAKSLARVELSKDSIFIYNQEGQMANEAKFADIVDLPMYQGLDKDGRRYMDRILVLKSGEEVVFPRYGEEGRQLKKRIQEATKMKFSFRNNATRRNSH